MKLFLRYLLLEFLPQFLGRKFGSRDEFRIHYPCSNQALKSEKVVIWSIKYFPENPWSEIWLKYILLVTIDILYLFFYVMFSYMVTEILRCPKSVNGNIV